MSDPLKQIKALMKANETSQARQQLEQYLTENPEDAQGWFLASFLRPSRQERLAAIQQAARLEPAHSDIRERLLKLQAGEKQKRALPWLPILAAVGFAAIVIIGFVLIRLNTPASVPGELPTLMVLQAATATPTQLLAMAQTQAEETDVFTPTSSILEPTITRTQPLVQLPTATESLNSPQPTLDVQPLVTASILSPVAPLPVITLPPGATDHPSTPISTGLPDATLPPASATVAVTPSPAGKAVPLNVGVEIGAGEFRVVDATRGAESLIQDLGGSFPPAPADHSWMLLELLLVCKNGAACVFDPAALKVVSPSGAAYSYSPQLDLPPTFGTVTQNNQIWGYLGFVVPTSESNLELTLSQNNQTYAFALG